MKSDKKQFTLNSANPRERVIADFLKTQFNMSDFIKDVLYQYIVSNNLNTNIASVHQDVVINTVSSNKDARNITQTIQHDAIKKVGTVKQDVENVNDDIKQVDSKDKVTISKETSNNDDFSIDLNNIADEEVIVSSGEKKKNSTQNALDYMLNM